MADRETKPVTPDWLEWRPANTAHVVGRYERRVFDEVTGLPEEQQFVVRCETCGAEWRGSCSSGNVRRRIQQFSVRHLHRDPLAGPVVVRPGSLRVDGNDD